MKTKTLFKIIFVLLIIIIITGSILLINKDNYIYKITYNDDTIPGNIYNILIYDNYDIKVEKQPLCSTKECIEGNYTLSKENFNVIFNIENKKIVKQIIETLFKNKNNNEIELTYYDLNKEQLIVIESIIYNNEKYLEEITNPRKLLFEVHSSRINCPTVSLNVYDDNTYRYTYTYGINGEKPKYIEGIYSYDISKLIQNINNYNIPENNIGPFLLTISDKNYEVYDNNLELQAFLQSININLDKCLESN